ncbi:patched domain-containing protein 3 [Lepeophtheirus salmonis]|uniref:patched domain-containing protein 3 n=1 Tax=Lepeophtheirus salmonis TaxID=72036 RepID=UPI001AEA61BB|nr:NPC intracellular cholesterol transporter 1-like [Lepeophtheirus salmonis]
MQFINVKPFHTCHERVNHGINWIFYQYGVIVAKYSYVFIGLSLGIFIASTLGFIDYVTESDPTKIWLPQDSYYVQNTKKIKDLNSDAVNAATVTQVIVESEVNILRAKELNAVYKLHSSIINLKAPSNETFKDLCFKERVTVPISTPPSEICRALANAEWLCSAKSIFEIWTSDESSKEASIIAQLTDEDILDALSQDLAISKLFRRPFRPIIGSKMFNDNGTLKGAKALLLSYSIKTNSSDKNGIPIWEKSVKEHVFNYSFGDESSNLSVTLFSSSIFRAEFQNGMENDVQLFIFGYLIVFVYIIFNLGEMNTLEHKFYLAVVGIACVGMGYASSVGIFQLLSVYATPMNSILPFMLLGIGIDDMFVIVQASKNVKQNDDEEGENKMDSYIGNIMKSAGVAITVTSLTDILAFGIGGFSQLPALRNFCLYSSAGIFFVYFYIMTFFLGWFVIDARRVESHRDACLPCIIKKSSWVPCYTRKSFAERLFSCSGVLIDSLFFRGLAIIVTIVVFGFGVYGLTLIEPKFDPKSYINPESKLLSYFKASEQHFQKLGGIPGQFYILNPNNSLVEIEKVYEELKNSEFIEENSLRTFHKAFSKTINSTTNFQYSSLTNFLYTSRVPFDWAVKFKASQKPVCGDTTEDVKLSAFVLYFQHIKKTRVQDQIQSMKKIYQIGEKIEGERNGLIFPHATQYSNLITLDIILSELTRNILLALMTVFIAALFLLADALTSIYVLLSILLSIIDVTGYMYFWGVSIDTASAVLLTVSLGLAVDYSAHIAHGYIHSSKSSRGEKVKDSLTKVGPAVLSGGISTFLAFILLANSSSIVFTTFFKIFFLVVLFGLYHGLIFLPVLLSFIGPVYRQVQDSTKK